MKAEIIIEQFDNGITIKWSDPSGAIDSQHIVALERDINPNIGKIIWEDISSVMNNSLACKVKMNIEYTPIEK